jgi:hypothetical protein
MNNSAASDPKDIALADQKLHSDRRVNFVNGLVLTANDLRQEQTYHLESDYRHNRLLHQSGIVHGLDVTHAAYNQNQVQDVSIRISEGIGIDYRGRVFVVSTPMSALLAQWVSNNPKPPPESEDEEGEGDGEEEVEGPAPFVVYVVANYRAVTEGKTIIAGKPCTPNDDGSLQDSRIRDDVDLRFSWTPPAEPLRDDTGDIDVLNLSDEDSAILLATLTFNWDKTTPLEPENVTVSMEDRPTVPNQEDIEELAKAPRREFATLSVLGPRTATLWVHDAKVQNLPETLGADLRLTVNDVDMTGSVADVNGVSGLYTITTAEDIAENARLALTFNLKALVELNTAEKVELEDFTHYVGRDGEQLTVYAIAASRPDVRPFVTYDLSITGKDDNLKHELTLWFQGSKIDIPDSNALSLERSSMSSVTFKIDAHPNSIYILTPDTPFIDGEQITVKFNADRITKDGVKLIDLMAREQFIYLGYDDSTKMINKHTIINLPRKPDPAPAVIPFASIDLLAESSTRVATQELLVWVNTQETLTISKGDVILRRNGGLVLPDRYEWESTKQDMWTLRLTDATDLFDDGELVELSFKANAIEVTRTGQKLDAYMAAQNFVYLGYNGSEIIQPTIIDLPTPDVLPFAAYGVERAQNAESVALTVWVNTAVGLTIDKADVRFERNGSATGTFSWAKLPASEVDDQQVWRLTPNTPFVDGDRVMLVFNASTINTTGANARTLVRLMEQGRFVYAGYDTSTRLISQPTIIALPPAPELSREDILALIDERINELRPLPEPPQEGELRDAPPAPDAGEAVPRARSRKR